MAKGTRDVDEIGDASNSSHRYLGTTMATSILSRLALLCSGQERDAHAHAGRADRDGRVIKPAYACVPGSGARFTRLIAHRHGAFPNFFS